MSEKPSFSWSVKIDKNKFSCFFVSFVVNFLFSIMSILIPFSQLIQDELRRDRRRCEHSRDDPEIGKRKILTNARAAVRLNRAVNNFQSHRRHDRFDHRNFFSRRFVADFIHHPRRFQNQKPRLFDFISRFGDPLRITPCSAKGFPKAIRFFARSFINSRARSAMPIRRIQ